MLFFCLIVILQLIAAQSIHVVDPNAIRGPRACQSQRSAVDLAMRSTSQTVRGILSTVSLIPMCGDGLWTRVAYLNMSDPSQQCPSSWRLYSANGVRACGRPVATTGGCYSQNYTTQPSYHRVCGRIIGYQIGSTDAFEGIQSIDEPYVDGVSVTYGEPRRHIWTFASGLSETIVTTHLNHERYNCPCALIGTNFQNLTRFPPAFVGDNYFCESANPLSSFQSTNVFQYTDDPLWDGKRCEGQCCTNSNSPPWFSVTLPDITNENIEVRICTNQATNNEDTAIGLLEIYVQ